VIKYGEPKRNAEGTGSCHFTESSGETSELIARAPPEIRIW